MICDNCGKNTTSKNGKCAYCGSKMPETTGGNGFYDILSIDVNSGPTATNNSVSEGYSDKDMQKLIKKTDNIAKTGEKNVLFSMIAVGLSGLILVSSLVLGANMLNTMKEQKKEIDEIKEKIEQMVVSEKKKEENDKNDKNKNLPINNLLNSMGGNSNGK